LAGIIDLEAFISIEQHICGGAVVEEVLGGKPAEVPERYAQASVTKMLPLGVPQILIWGQREQFVPISLLEKYTQTAEHAGDPARLVSLPEAGHFEIVSPFSATWPAVEGEILSLLAKRP
jgi:pimeloyl-ACP methyl ester carboxylesterase